ncbi:FG-GAP-like repeat-containing protein [Pleionea sp. CnH1-48]|uniref:FG-GAP-like repeat-containing protein n=1 Tax=Pleionea sp. CnH1-48 TaxID=2954494 RepID=UPI0020975C29|nr:FG-GAP-like repeat-containing protein [Pleionea sp. CnH1-48]MCO7225978.1 FG-GAP-like repeat-containing protein [Pleionea sp. CnH1-48]
MSNISFKKILYGLVVTIGCYQPLQAATVKMDDGNSINTASWMTDTFIVHNKPDVPLRELMIPGTHDSGTSQVAVFNGVTAVDDCDSAILAYGLEITTRWAQAQDTSVLTQLKDGIRYVDLRVAWDEDDESTWIIHCYKSVRLTAVLDDLKTFSLDHPNEIVIVDFQSIKIEESEMGQFYDELKSVFPSNETPQLLIDSSSGVNKGSTIKELQGQAGNLLFLMGEKDVSDLDSRYHYRKDFLKDKYANSSDPSTVQEKVEGILEEYDLSKLTKVQAVLTPQTTDIIMGLVISDESTAVVCSAFIVFCPEAAIALGVYKAIKYFKPSITFPDSLEELSDVIKKKVVKWVKDYRKKGLRTNIVIADYFEKTHLVEYAIQTNYGSNNKNGTRLGDKNEYLSSGSSGDFDGNGIDDLVVNGGLVDVDGKIYAGEVRVLYGKSGGFEQGQYDEHVINQDTYGIPGFAEAYDHFGTYTASGDFNHDGYDDLAISIHSEDLNADIENSYQSLLDLGLELGDIDELDTIDDIDGNWVMDYAEENYFPDCETNSLSEEDCQDYIEQQTDSLLVAIQSYITKKSGAGAIVVVYGSELGLDTETSQLWHLDSPDVVGSTDSSDKFGSFLSSADFNGDGFDDLAISAEGRDVKLNDGTTSWRSGAVFILKGSSQGITGVGSQELHLGDTDNGLAGSAEHVSYMDETGTGDFNNDGYDDLAISASFYNSGGVSKSGAFVIVYGSQSGLDEGSSLLVDRANYGGYIESDYFGGNPVVDDVNGDGFDDLAVRSFYDSSDSKSGAITLIHGSANGLDLNNWGEWHQDVSGIEGVAEHEQEYFGSAAHLVDINGDGFADLVAGSSSEDHDTTGHSSAGSINVIFGSSLGLTANGNLYLHQDHIDNINPVESYDYFGSHIFSGDFDGNGFLDLVVGAPGEDNPAVHNDDEGILHIIMQNDSAGMELTTGVAWEK